MPLDGSGDASSGAAAGRFTTAGAAPDRAAGTRTGTGTDSHVIAPAPPTPPPAPAELSAGVVARDGTDKRWCEEVTVAFRNTGGTAVRDGTLTFETHVIGALVVDCGTVESTEELPVPIEAGTRKERAWTVCVDAWRVPLGMHIETRDVSVQGE